MTRLLWSALALLAFVVLATANSGGYRYGVSDQAYYLPAVEQHLDADLFPRDAALLDAQSRLMTVDDLTAALRRVTGASMETMALVVYLASLVLLGLASAALARGLRFPWWTVAAFGLLLTFRHRIAKTGANSIEGYMHPRQLAFGVGVAALACFVRARPWWGAGLLAAAALLHPTTALWFILLVACGHLAWAREWRRSWIVAAAVAGLVAVWAVTAGPLDGRLVTMDGRWLSVLAEKDYLFPTDWTADVWALNLLYPLVIIAVWQVRLRRGDAVPAETVLAWGALGLTLIFLLTLPLTALRLALAVQLQISRVFWILDFLALGYLAWAITRSTRWAPVVVAVLALASLGRGYYLLEHYAPERTLAQVSLPNTPWTDAMTWLRGQPEDWHVLADPGHAWKYGSSVRVAAGRDTVLESVKDSAIALYDPAIAARVSARIDDLVDYEQLTDSRARALDAEYDLDVVITEITQPLNLPVLYRNTQFVIYDVR